MTRKSLLTVAMGLLLVGCAACAAASPDLRAAPFDVTTQDEGRHNLAAIRSLLVQRDAPGSVTPPQRERPHGEPAGVAWPPDWLSSFFMPVDLSVSELGTTTPPVSGSSSPLPRTPSSRRAVVNKRFGLRAAPPPPREVPTEWSRPVPAYTILAPGPTSYPGTIRCAPDLLGGQRCRAE